MQTLICAFTFCENDLLQDRSFLHNIYTEKHFNQYMYIVLNINPYNRKC